MSGQKDELIELAQDENNELFHWNDEAYAHLEGKKTVKVRGKELRRYLVYRYYLQHGGAPGTQALQDAVGTLEAKAIFEGDEIPVHIRTAGDSWREIFFDLGTSDYSAVRITPGSWVIIDRPPVRFYRPPRLRGYQAEPISGSDIEEELRPFLNIETENQWILLLAFITDSMRPSPEKVHAVVNGQQGSGKSDTCKLIKRSVDPNAAELRSQPKEERNLAIAAQNDYLLVFDNSSSISGDLSDAYCGLSTGRAFSTRALYTDTEETTIDALRPVVLNGITDFVNRSDLMDRSIFLSLPVIEEEDRIPEMEYWKKFYEREGKILGALFDIIAEAMRHYPEDTPPLPRMTEFSKWGIALEKAMGWPEGAFLDAYRENRNSSNELAIEGNPVAKEVRKLVRTMGYWSGTASELLNTLNENAAEEVTAGKYWPSNARWLSDRLKRAAPNLRGVGVDVIFDNHSTAERIVRISRKSNVHSDNDNHEEPDVDAVDAMDAKNQPHSKDHEYDSEFDFEPDLPEEDEEGGIEL